MVFRKTKIWSLLKKEEIKEGYIFHGKIFKHTPKKIRCELSADYMGLESALKLMLEDGESLLFVTLILNEIDFRV